MTIEHYTPGERVLALPPGVSPHDEANWKPGYVVSDAPYHKANTGGAYVNWDLPANAPAEVSRGGWQPQNTIRRVEAA